MVITILSIVLGILPGLAWLVFYLHEDLRRPEPKRLIFLTFLAGGLVTALVLQAQIFTNNWLSAYGYNPYGFISFLVLGGVEEVFKFLVVYFLISRRKEFDEPLDAMIYMIVAALGFATVENIGSILQSGSFSLSAPGPLETTILRFVGATLLHSLSSGIVGYYWGRALARKVSVRLPIIKGLLVATLLHAIFNYLIIKSEPVALPLVFLLFVGLFVLSDFEKLKHI